MARKIIKKDEVSYVCEKCNNGMFKFLVKEKEILTPGDPLMFKKYLDRGDPKKPTTEPYYECQFCGTIHKGYYTNSGQNIDFRPLNGK